MAGKGPTPNDRALTLDRGLRLLELLAASDEDQTVSALAVALDLHRQRCTPSPSRTIPSPASHLFGDCPPRPDPGE